MLTRFGSFVAERYPAYYAVYAALWVLAWEALTTQIDGQAWRPSWHSAARIVVVALLVLYLRVIDELKDVEYDRLHNPGRPLVTGAVSTGDLVALAVLAAVPALVLGGVSGMSAVVAVGVVAAYGLLLWLAELRIRAVRERVLVSLVVTYPVQLLICGFLLLSLRDDGVTVSVPHTLVAAVVFAGAFLQFEFARKTSRDDRSDPHQYSSAWGPAVCIAAIVMFAMCSAIAAASLGIPAAFVPLILPIVGSGLFVRSGRREFPVVWSVLFIVTLYAVIIGVGAWA